MGSDPNYSTNSQSSSCGCCTLTGVGSGLEYVGEAGFGEPYSRKDHFSQRKCVKGRAQRLCPPMRPAAIKVTGIDETLRMMLSAFGGSLSHIMTLRGTKGAATKVAVAQYPTRTAADNILQSYRLLSKSESITSKASRSLSNQIDKKKSRASLLTLRCGASLFHWTTFLFR